LSGIFTSSKGIFVTKKAANKGIIPFLLCELQL
jgi:hypothetical protein